MKFMSKRRTQLGVSLLLLLLGLGATIGREIVEADDGTGMWIRISSRFVLPWQAGARASMHPEADRYSALRVTRWYCYGLGFKHTEHHSGTRRTECRTIQSAEPPRAMAWRVRVSPLTRTRTGRGVAAVTW